MSSIAISIVPLLMEEILDVVRLISQEHIQRRMVEEPLDVSAPQDAIEDCNKDQLSNTIARIEAVEKSISELHERVTKDTETRQKQHSEVMTLIANNAAATELLKLTSQTVQKTVEVPQVQYTDRIVGVPVTAHRQVPTIQTTQKTVAVPQVMAKTVEIPQLPFAEKIVENPETQMFQGTQTFVSLNTAEQTAAKEDLEADTAKHSSILRPLTVWALLLSVKWHR